MKKIKINFTKEKINEECPVQHALQFISGKWRIGILWSIKDQSRRFGELKRDMSGISEKMLIQELRQLEEYKVVKRKSYPVIPPHVEYSLTERGETLIPLIELVVAWGYSDLEKYKLVI